MKRIVGLILLISVLLVSCNAEPDANGGNSQILLAPASEDEVPVEVVEEPDPEVEDAIETTIEEGKELSPSTEPVEVTFTAADGFELNGVYYPSVYMDAPVVVLMHQANMNMHQWDTIALWLQNAGGKQSAISAYHAAKPMQTEPWQDSSWFPELADDFSVSVFTFTFRGCEDGCSHFEPEGWVLDATAALKKAASMPEVDASRVVPVGTSIGADGAVDGCVALGGDSAVNCLNSFSLSPGSYMDIIYADTVETLIKNGNHEYCFATEGDAYSAEACRSVEIDDFSAYVEEGSEHGIEMVNPEHEVNILEMLRDYLVNKVL